MNELFTGKEDDVIVHLLDQFKVQLLGDWRRTPDFKRCAESLDLVYLEWFGLPDFLLTKDHVLVGLSFSVPRKNRRSVLRFAKKLGSEHVKLVDDYTDSPRFDVVWSLQEHELELGQLLECAWIVSKDMQIYGFWFQDVEELSADFDFRLMI